jgi:NitT/TauT family transport system substrate-binding protein
MKEKMALMLAMLIFALLFAGCASGGQPPQGAEKTPIKIALNPWAGYAHAFVAKEKGMFEKNGAYVELIYVEDYSEMQRMYDNGEIDGVFAVYPDAIYKSASGIGAKLVYVADYSETADSIVGKMELDSLAGLKGKKVSVDSINSFSHMFVLKALEKAGLGEGEVQFEVVPAQDVPAALESGRIDAGHTWEPFKSTVLANGYKVLANAKDTPGVIVDVLLIKPRMIEDRPEEVKALVKSLFEARSFVLTNRNEALEIMARNEKTSVEDMAAGLAGIHQPDVAENIAAMSKANSDSLYASGDYIIEFYLDRGQISKRPDLNEIIEPKFVESAG